MRGNFVQLTFFLLYLLSVAPSADAQQQQTYYVYDGKNLRVTYGSAAQADYLEWQIWLYQESVHIPRYGAGLPYSRWGLIQGRSAEGVMKQLKAFQSFERAFLNFFGSGTWGPNTFLNPLGPIATASDEGKKQPSEESYLGQLNYRIQRVIATVQPSLENNEKNGLALPVKDYFDRIRGSVQQVAAIYSQLVRVQPQLHFVDNQIARARTAVEEAESNVPKITAVLPNVKLPTNHAWMSHEEWAGSDGIIIIKIEVTEGRRTVLVEQTWTGGDGSMTGTVALTTIPYENIGNVALEPPLRDHDDAWTVRVESAGGSFPETWSSPERKTAKGVFRAVNYKTTKSVVYLAFTSRAEAHDAYAYFRYHQELGR